MKKNINPIYLQEVSNDYILNAWEKAKKRPSREYSELENKYLKGLDSNDRSSSKAYYRLLGTKGRTPEEQKKLDRLIKRKSINYTISNDYGLRNNSSSKKLDRTSKLANVSAAREKLKDDHGRKHVSRALKKPDKPGIGETVTNVGRTLKGWVKDKYNKGKEAINNWIGGSSDAPGQKVVDASLDSKGDAAPTAPANPVSATPAATPTVGPLAIAANPAATPTVGPLATAAPAPAATNQPGQNVVGAVLDNSTPVPNAAVNSKPWDWKKTGIIGGAALGAAAAGAGLAHLMRRKKKRKYNRDDDYYNQ